MNNCRFLLPNYGHTKPYMKKHLQKLLDINLGYLSIDSIEVDDNLNVTIVGEDEDTAISFLQSKFPMCLDNDVLLSSPFLLGYLVDLGAVGFGIFADVGYRQNDPKIFVSTSKDHNSLLSLHALRRQFRELNKDSEKKLSLRGILSLAKLHENIPYQFTLVEKDSEEGKDLSKLSIEFSKDQIKAFGEERKIAERILYVQGAPHSSVLSTLMKREHMQDVEDIEQCGVFETKIIFKEGTRATGIIPRIGSTLKANFQTI